MTGFTPHTPELNLRPFIDRMQQLGMLVLTCAPDGSIDNDQPITHSLLQRTLLGSPLFRTELRECIRAVADSGDMNPIRLLEGIWALPIPMMRRRCCTGFVIVIVLTTDILESSTFNVMIAADSLDEAIVRQLIVELPPAAEQEIPRLATFIRHTFDDQTELTARMVAVETVGRQLGDTYEEISFLYSIIQNIRVVERPERFVSIACEELIETLPYAWIGARFINDTENLRSLSDSLVLIGNTGVDPSKLRAATDHLFGETPIDSPDVIDAARVSELLDQAPSTAMLVYPIARDDRTLGILMAGEKQGPDREVSSVDMKLLGATATQLAIFLENATLYHDLNAMFMGTLEALTASIDAKDRYTCGHSQRVAQLTAQLTAAAGFDETIVERMHIAGLVHDVGKIGVPERVLQKPGRLSEEEFSWIRRHPDMGYRILKDIPKFKDILPGVLHHHERWDGNGYPNGLAGTDIPIAGRLIALADSFDAMSSTRTYRARLSRPEVIAEIQQCSGTQFDPELVPLFLNLDFSEFDRLVMVHQGRDEERGAA